MPGIEQELFSFFKNNPIPEIPFQMLDIISTMNQLPMVRTWFLTNKIFPSVVAYASVNAYSETAIHIDHGNCALAINLPLYNCSTAKTFFYQCDKKYFKKVRGRTNLDYFDVPKEHSTLVNHYVMTKPVLLNLHYPHNVVNDTDDNRYCLSFRFPRTPLHLL